MARTGSLRILLSTGAMALSVSGCMIPVYHQPQGFSSTYYRHLQQSAPLITGPQPAPLDLAKSLEKPESLSDAESTAEDKESTPVAEKSGSWWSWIRQPMTFRANSASKPDEDEDEDDDAEAEEASAAPANRR